MAVTRRQRLFSDRRADRACVLSVVAWINFHATISWLVMGLMHGEIGLLRHFTNRFDLADRQMAAYASNEAHVTLRNLYGITQAVGLAVSIPAAGLMTVLAALCMLRAAPSRFRRKLNIDCLIQEQSRSFPASTAFASRHLRLTAPGDAIRPADYALTPEEWICRHARRGKDGPFDASLAAAALAAQLGSPWRGVEHAVPHVRALFSAFALHLSERRTEAQALLGALSQALPTSATDAPAGPDIPLIIPECG